MTCHEIWNVSRTSQSYPVPQARFYGSCLAYLGGLDRSCPDLYGGLHCSIMTPLDSLQPPEILQSDAFPLSGHHMDLLQIYVYSFVHLSIRGVGICADSRDVTVVCSFPTPLLIIGKSSPLTQRLSRK